MSKASDKSVGNAKRLVGEILGDGKLVAEGERQKRVSDTEENETSSGAKTDRPRRT